MDLALLSTERLTVRHEIVDLLSAKTAPPGEISKLSFSRLVPRTNGLLENFSGTGRQGSAAPSILGHELNDPEKPARTTGNPQRKLRVLFLYVRRNILDISECHNPS